MSERSIGNESSTTAHKRHARATLHDEGPPPASPLGHSSSASITKIQMSLDIHLIAGLILPFVPDRVTWNNVCCASKELYRAGKNLTPPWPNTTIKVYSTTHHDVRAVAFSPSGSHLAFGTNQGSVRVWDRWGKETILQGDTGPISCLGYSSDGRCLASGTSQCGSIRLWHTESFHTTSTKTYSDTPTARPLVHQADISILLGNHSSVAALAFSRTDSNLLASGGWNGEIKLWNVKEQACIHSYQALRSSDIIPTLNFSRGDRSVCNAVVLSGSMIRLWRAEGSSEFTSAVIDIPGAVRRQGLPGGTVVCPAFSPCGSFLTIAYSTPSRDRSGIATKIDLYEVGTMIKSQSVVIPDFASVCSVVSQDSKQLVLGGTRGRSRLFQTDDLSIQRDLNTRRGGPQPTSYEPVWCVAFDPTCRVLAFGCRDGRVVLRSL
jgi:WD40 repeat protein